MNSYRSILVPVHQTSEKARNIVLDILWTVDITLHHKQSDKMTQLLLQI